MKIYGFFTESKSPKLLEQVTLEVDAQTLRKLADFLLQCASEIENDNEWEHEHFSDYLDQELDQDIVIYNLKKS